jgi:hypothetical protein
MTEDCEKRRNLSLHRKEEKEKVVLACNLPVMITVILVFAVNLSLWIITCNQYNIEFLYKFVIL